MTIENIKPIYANEWADFWYNEIGVNPIPQDTKHKGKENKITWKEWQDNPLPKEKFEQWKQEGLYEKYGIGVICGKIWRGKYAGKYLIGVDLDNKKAIDELCPNGLEQYAQRTLIEQHKDNPNKAHYYCLSDMPVTKKSSDVTNLKDKIDSDEVPAFEVKGEGSHGLMFATPSIHANGSRYEIIGIRELLLRNNIEQDIDDICSNYNIPYLSQAKNGKSLIPMSELIKDDTIIHEKHNRHEAVMRYMESKKIKNKEFTDSQILESGLVWNNTHCKPPLSLEQMNKQLKYALNFTGRIEEKKNTDDTKLSEYAEQILKDNKFKTLDDTREILYYQEGVYRQGGDVLIAKECEKIIPECSKYKVSEVLDIIRRRTFCKRDEFNKSDFICLGSNLFSLKTYETKDYSPDELITTKIPFKLNPEARCPKFIKFLKDCLPEPDDITTVIEEFANIFTGNKTNFEKCAMYIGKGQNGKSCYMKIMGAIIGDDNTCAVSIHALNNDRFSIADLYGKYANIFADISNEEITYPGEFKQAVSGDRMRGQRKNQQPFNFKPFAKHFFSANDMPDFKDNSDGVWRRIIVTKWEKQFIGKDKILDLDQIIVKEEAEGILRFVIENLKTLVRRGKFRYEQSISEVRNEIKIQSNKIREFVDQLLIVDPNSVKPISVTYTKYHDWCKSNKIEAKTKGKFGNELEHLLGVAKDVVKIDGKTVRVFRGIGFKNV